MALTKPVAQSTTGTQPDPTTTPATAAVKPVAKFESMDETTANAAAANEATTTPPHEPAAAVAIPVSAAVVLSTRAEASAFQKEVEAMKAGADFAYGNFAVFKGINGVIKGTGDNKTSLGRWAKVSMIAWDDRVQISPGSDAESAKECVAYSKDGIKIDSVIGFEKYGRFIGAKVDDYLAYLKDSDWLKASASRYIDVACIVHDGESKAAKEMVGEVICISLSKSSIPSFQAYQSNLNMKAKAVARGGALATLVKLPEDPFTFFFQTEAASKDGKDWTKLKVSDRLKLED